MINDCTGKREIAILASVNGSSEYEGFTGTLLTTKVKIIISLIKPATDNLKPKQEHLVFRK